jgi:hypothetical protein
VVRAQRQNAPRHDTTQWDRTTSGYNNRLPESDAKTKAAQARVLRAETIGLLVLALLILGMILVRWGHFFNWHAR